MSIDVSSAGPIAGTVKLPGDRRLTLAVLAFAMMTSEAIKLVNPSQASDVDSFMAFLAAKGAKAERIGDLIHFTGKPWDGEVRITDAVPEDILHCVIASAVFSSSRVVIEQVSGRRDLVTGMLFDTLRPLGLADSNIARDGEDVIISGASFEVDGTVSAGSAWALESLAAAAIGKAPLNVSFYQSYASHVLRLISLTGFSVEKYDGEVDPGYELERRLARSGEGRTPVLRKLVWHGLPDGEIAIPGDVTIAAAICGTAALVQRSKVTMSDVCWEQGRRGFFEALKRMKIDITWEPSKSNSSFETASVRIKWSRSDGIHLTAEQAAFMGPELPILSVVTTAADGKSVIITDGKSPLPERSMFAILSQGLERMGAHVGDFADGIIVDGGNELRGAEDVEMGDVPETALALAVAGLAASGNTTLTGNDEFGYPVGTLLDTVRKIEHKQLL